MLYSGGTRIWNQGSPSQKIYMQYDKKFYMQYGKFEKKDVNDYKLTKLQEYI
jgi:hypothetical protein